MVLSFKFATSYDVILERRIKLVEISAPTPNAHDKVGIFFGMRLGIKQNFSVDRIELQLMAAQINKALYKLRRLFYTDVVAQNAVVYLKGKRTAVYDV